MTDQQLQSIKVENENQLQCKVILIASQEFPQLRGKIWHTKNESYIRRIAIEENGVWRVETDSELEKRRKVEGSVNKAMGMLPGVPDVLFLWKGKLYWIELKVSGGVLSDSQKDLHYNWRNDSSGKVCYDVFSSITYIKSVVYGEK